MNYENRPNRQPSVAPVAFFTSLATSLVVTLAILILTGNFKPLANEDEKEAKDVRNVPSIIGVTPEIAGDVVRARGLRLLVSGEREDSKVPKGQIVDQDPMAGSDLNAGGAIKVVVSLGVKEIEVPEIIGKPIDDAKELLTDKGLAVGDIDETGTGDPGTVTDADPKPGTKVEEGKKVDIVMSPAGMLVPDVTNKYFGKAKKELEEAGFKKGKVTWKYNDYKDANIVLSQEPEAGAIAPLGTEINLVVNEED